MTEEIHHLTLLRCVSTIRRTVIEAGNAYPEAKERLNFRLVQYSQSRLYSIVDDVKFTLCVHICGIIVPFCSIGRSLQNLKVLRGIYLLFRHIKLLKPCLRENVVNIPRTERILGCITYHQMTTLIYSHQAISTELARPYI